MNFRKSGRGPSDVPTIVADMNGTIIFLNSSVTTSLPWLKIGDNVSSVVDLDYVRKMTMFQNKLDVSMTKVDEFDRAVVKISGIGVTRLMEVSLYKVGNVHNEVVINEKKLFSTYSSIISSVSCEKIDLREFVERLVECMKADLRFAYRDFQIRSGYENEAMLLNVQQISTLVVCIIVLINEIEYRSPFVISIDKLGENYMMTVSTKSKTFTNARGVQEISEKYPSIAIRLAYLTSLCKDCGIEHSLSVTPTEIRASFEISSYVVQAGTLHSASVWETMDSFVANILPVLMYDGFSGIKGEEQE